MVMEKPTRLASLTEVLVGQLDVEDVLKIVNWTLFRRDAELIEDVPGDLTPL